MKRASTTFEYAATDRWRRFLVSGFKGLFAFRLVNPAEICNHLPISRRPFRWGANRFHAMVAGRRSACGHRHLPNFNNGMNKNHEISVFRA